MDNVELEFMPDALRAIAKKAIARDTGARGLRAIMEETLIHTMFIVPSDPTIERVIINSNCIENNEEPMIVRGTDTKRTKKLRQKQNDIGKVSGM